MASSYFASAIPFSDKGWRRLSSQELTELLHNICLVSSSYYQLKIHIYYVAFGVAVVDDRSAELTMNCIDSKSTRRFRIISCLTLLFIGEHLIEGADGADDDIEGCFCTI
jgi:hypothetical protein